MNILGIEICLLIVNILYGEKIWWCRIFDLTYWISEPVFIESYGSSLVDKKRKHGIQFISFVNILVMALKHIYLIKWVIYQSSALFTQKDWFRQ